MSSRSDGGWPPFPEPAGRPIPLRKVAPDVIACRSEAINPWIPSIRSCCTITKTPFRGIFKTARGVREPTEAELKIIGTFPEAFRFGSKANAWARIGNCVPPKFAQAIATCIREGILGDREFTYLSAFAGCGGSSLGYKWAGGHGVAAIEFDANAAETYRLNFPETPVLERDIATVTAEELLTLTGLKVGKLDILDGSPPCQGFSTAGKRILTDPRNSLFREYIRLIEGLQPKVFVMENVSGMVKGKMRLVFREIMLALKATGYAVRCKLLNAMYYEVPQSRERLIWVGVRADLGKGPGFPEPIGKPVAAAKAMYGMDSIGSAPSFRVWNKQLWNKQKAGEHGDGKNCYNHVKLHPEKPSPTVPKSCVFGGFSGLSHWAEPRALSIGELAAVSSFPKGFTWPADYDDAHNCIGNSVPPRFMYHIAKRIKETILESTGEQFPEG